MSPLMPQLESHITVFHIVFPQRRNATEDNEVTLVVTDGVHLNNVPTVRFLTRGQIPLDQ